MSTGNLVKTDLYELNNVVQMSLLSYSKEIFIEVLRDEFAKDSYYHFVKDDFGFPKTPSVLNFPQDAGIKDDLTSRIFIGEAFHFDQVLYPAILIRSGSFRSVPLSMSRNRELVQYKVTKVIDGYGNEKLYSTPAYYDLAGAWEGQISIDIYAGDVQARDELSDVTLAILQIFRYRELMKSGVFIRSLSIGTPSESEDRSNKIYKQTITADVRTEWRQQTPVSSIIDSINFCIEFGNTNVEPFVADTEINFQFSLLDVISNL